MESAEEHYIKNLTYPEFKSSCEKIVGMSDTELASTFGLAINPSEIRMKYRHILESTTPEGYEKLRSANPLNFHKGRGNQLFAIGNYESAITEYSHAISRLQEVQDPLVKSAAEVSLRLNLAACYLKLNNLGETIKQCEKALDKEPYNPKGIYRIATAYKTIGNPEKAKEYLRRVIVRRTTDEKLVQLYHSLIPPGEKFPLEELRKCLHSPADVKNLMHNNGFVLSDPEIDSLVTSQDPAQPVSELDKARRLQCFLKYPAMEDLVEDPVLLAEVERVAENPESEFVKNMLQKYPTLTHAQLAEAIKGIRMRARLEKLPSKRWFTGFLGMVIVAVIAYYVLKRVV